MLSHKAPPVKRVLLAQPRGYRAGVDRAVEAVERALKLHGLPVNVRNEIAHSRHVAAILRGRRVFYIKNTDEVQPSAVMMFSARGVSPAVRVATKERGLQVIDATCPLVTTVHNTPTNRRGQHRVNKGWGSAGPRGARESFQAASNSVETA